MMKRDTHPHEGPVSFRARSQTDKFRKPDAGRISLVEP
jgi:hypothetical protein